MNSKIGNYAKVRRGASPRPISDPKYFGGNTGWVRIVDVTASKKYLRKTDQYVSKLGESLSVKVDRGDLIMSICGTIGRPIIVDIPACIHDGFVLFYDLNGVDAEYLYYTLQFNEKQLENKGQPGTQVNLNTSIVSNHEVFIPPLFTQRKIAHILSTIDGQIEKTEAIIAKYQAIKQGMLQDLFTRGIDVNTGQLRPRYEDVPELYTESQLGMIPKEWEVKQLKDVCLKIVDCKNRTSPFVSISKFPVIRTSNIRNGELVWDDMKYTDEISYQIWTERAIPEADDIIITREAPLGEIMKIPHGITPCLGQRTMLYKLDSEKLLPDFLVSFIMFPPVQSYLNSIAGGSTVKHLKVEEMKEILILKPKLGEQERIVRLIVSQQTVINQFKKSLTKLHLLKQGLMQDLLSGKVEVKL